MKLATDQLGYALGDTGRSFVVGFGKNYPKQPHHRSSSCYPNEDCRQMGHDFGKRNNFILYGALVGGPDGLDKYTDTRGDYIGKVELSWNLLHCDKYDIVRPK